MRHTTHHGRTWRWLAALALIVVASTGVAACGGGDDDGTNGGTDATTTAAPTASQLEGLDGPAVLEKVKAAAAGAKSVHVTGDINAGGTKISLDLTLGEKELGKGTIDVNGVALEVIRVGADAYIKASAEAYAQLIPQGGDQIGKIVGGKWLKGPAASGQFAAFAGFTDLQTFIGELLTPDGKVSRVDGKDVDGTPTVGLRSDASDSDGTLYVADAGNPYPLLIEAPAGSEDTGAIRFSDWDADVDVTAPPEAEAIDITALGGATP